MRIVYYKPKKTVMQKLNNPLLTLAVLAGVVALGWYAYPVAPTHDMHGNKLEDVQAFYAELQTADETIVDIYEGE